MSQILQKNTNYNFTDYINGLHVEKAKKYLTDIKYSDYTIVSICLECGFYSKSTFYKAFSKFTNTTPNAYKQENNYYKIVPFSTNVSHFMRNAENGTVFL